MADENNSNGGVSGGKEAIAYRLMHDIMVAEDHTTFGFADSQGLKRATREYMLGLYGECLAATSGQAPAAKKAPAAAKKAPARKPAAKK